MFILFIDIYQHPNLNYIFHKHTVNNRTYIDVIYNNRVLSLLFNFVSKRARTSETGAIREQLERQIVYTAYCTAASD